MARLVQVDFDPFEGHDSGITLTPVDEDPFDVARIVRERRAAGHEPAPDPRDVAAERRRRDRELGIEPETEASPEINRALNRIAAGHEEVGDRPMVYDRTHQQGDRADYFANADAQPEEIRGTMAFLGQMRSRMSPQQFPWLYRGRDRLTDQEIGDIVMRSRDEIAGMSPQEATQYLFGPNRGRRQRNEATASLGTEDRPPEFQADPLNADLENPATGGTQRERAGFRDFGPRRPLTEEQQAARNFNREVIEQRLSRFGEEGPGFAGGLGQYLLGMTQKVTGGMAGAVGTVLDDIGSAAGMDTSGANYLQRLGRYMGERGLQRETAATPDYEPGSAKWYAFNGAEALVEMGLATGAAVGTRNPAAVTSTIMGLRVFAEQYDDSIRQGRTPHEAMLDGTFYGVAEAIPENIALHEIWAPGQRFLHRAVTGVAAEGAQEMFTEVMQAGWDAGVLDQDMTWGQAWDRIKQAGILGGIVGGPIAVAGHGAEALRRPGIIERAESQPPPITPEDVASPIPTDLIAQGKAEIDQALAGEQADAILDEALGHRTGDRISVTIGDQERQGTVKDAFTEDDDELGPQHGAVIEWDHGGQSRERFTDLEDAGARIERPAVVQPRRAEAGRPRVMNYVAREHGFAEVPSNVRTLGQASDFATQVNRAGADSSAMGTYQITGDTLRDFAPRVFGDNWRSVEFNQAAQDRIAEAIFNSARGSAEALRGRWASLTLAEAERVRQMPWEQARIEIARGESGATADELGGNVEGEIGTSETVEPNTDWIERGSLGMQDNQIATDEPVVEPVMGDSSGDGTLAAPVSVATAEDVRRAEQQADPEPTPAQAEAMNYRHAHLKLQGMDIAIETPKGAMRRGVDSDGQPWENESPAAYGRIKRTTGGDGEQIDVYVGDNPQSTRAFVVDQHDPETGKFDETKTVLGADSREEATAIYDAGFSDGSGPSRRGAITEMSVPEFRAWVASDASTGPAAPVGEEAPPEIAAALDSELSDSSGQLPAAQPSAKIGRFNPDDHIEALRSHVAKGGSLDEKAVAAKLSIKPAQARQTLGLLASIPNSGLRVNKKGKFRREPVARGPIDAIRFLRNGGVRDDEGHELMKSRNWHLSSPGLINRNGRSIDEAGRALWEAGYFNDRDPSDPSQRPTEAETLEFIENAIKSPAYAASDLEEVAKREGSAEDKKARANADYAIREIVTNQGLNLSADEHDDALDRMAAGDSAAIAVERVLREASARSLNDLDDETGNDFYGTFAESIYEGDTAEQRGDRDGPEAGSVGPESVEAGAGQREAPGGEPAQDGRGEGVETGAGAPPAADTQEPSGTTATGPTESNKSAEPETSPEATPPADVSAKSENADTTDVATQPDSSDPVEQAKSVLQNALDLLNGKTDETVEAPAPANDVAPEEAPISPSNVRAVVESEQPRYQRRLNDGDDPVFYSALERAVEASTTKRASAGQWAATLSKAPGVKKEELEWSGLFDWMDAQTGPVSRDDLLAVIRDGGIKVEEVVLGAEPTQQEIEALADETLESVVQDQMGDGLSEEDARDFANSNYAKYLEAAEDTLRAGESSQFASWSSDPSNPTYRELLITLPIAEGGNPERDFPTHWDQEAVVAHARFMDKTDADGKRVMFIEEVQSDWHQKGRDEGYEKTLSAEEMAARDQALAEARTTTLKAYDALIKGALEKAREAVIGLRKQGVDMPGAYAEQWANDADKLEAEIANFDSLYADEQRAGVTTFMSRHLWTNQITELYPLSKAVDAAQLVENEAAQAASRRSEGSIPDAPFKSTWPALVMKRAIRWAADNGYDKIAWTTGDEQADRYNLAQRTGTIAIVADNGRMTGQPDQYMVRFDNKEAEGALMHHFGAKIAPEGGVYLTSAQVKEVFGGGLGGRMLERADAGPTTGPRKWQEFRGEDLKIGGEGMKAFYDRNLVNIANDIIKKHGGKVGPVEIEGVNPGRAPDTPEVIVARDRLAEVRADRVGYAGRHMPEAAREEYERAEGEAIDELNRAVTASRVASGMDAHPGFEITPQLADAARSGFPLFALRRAQSRPLSDAQVAEIAERLATELESLGVADRIALKVANGLLADKGAQGAYFRRVIQVATDMALNPDATLRHEVIHAMRNLGLFTPSEWTALTKQALADPGVQQFLKSGDYTALSSDQRAEEAVAEFFARWRTERAEAKGFAAKAFQRLLDFVHALGRVVARVRGKEIGAGTVMRQIERGKIGRRETGAGLEGAPRPRVAEAALQNAPAIDPATAKKILSDYRVKRGLKVGDKARFWRGQSDQSGHGMATYGLGLYVAADRSVAKDYAGDDGEVVEMDRTDLPRDPLRFATTNDFQIWRQQAFRELGYDNNLAFVADYPDFGLFVRALDPEIDGIQMFTGKDAVFVTYSEEGPAYQEGEEDGFGFDPEQPERSMTQRQRSDLEARQQQSMSRRPDQDTFGRAGPLFGDEEEQGMLFQQRPPAALWNDVLNRNRTLTGAAKTRGKLDAFAESFDKWRTNFQDRMLPLLRVETAIEQTIGRPLTEQEKPYRQEALYTGRVGAQMEHMEQDIVAPLFEAMKEEGVTTDELESYLYARHAPERNAKLKSEGVDDGSGMSDIEAAAIMKRAADAGKLDALKRVAAQFDKLTAFALDTRVAGGLMSQDDADQWRSTYKSYAPLRGNAEFAEGERPAAGKGITVRGPESKRAFGRKSKADDILAYAMMQAEEAIIRAEKNRIATELYNLVKANPDKNFWQLHKVTMKKGIDPDTGLQTTTVQTAMTPGDEPLTVNLKVDGKPKRITFNRSNPAAVRAADAMRRTNEPELNVRALQIINQYLSRVNTALSPDFLWRNAIRDLETATANMSEFDMKGLRRDFLKGYPQALKAATKGAFGGESTTEWDQAWHDFTDEGGRVFYNQIKDVDQLKKEIEKRFAKLRDKNLSPKQAGLVLWEGFKWVGDKIDKANLGVENAARLSFYKSLVDRGISKKEAASRAKAITVNFNKRGVYGVLMNSLYLFYNASMQGNMRMLMALKHRRTQKIAASMIAAGALSTIFNVMAGGGDDDDENYYDKISDFEKSTNLIFMIPGSGGRYIKIPMAYGYNIFPEIGRHMVEVSRGRESPLEATGNWLYTAANSFNPIGGSEGFANLIAPTVADPAVDLLVDNRDYADRPIMPDQMPFGPTVPDSQRFWPSVPPYFRALTDALNKGTGGDAVQPGAVDISPETLDYLTQYATGAAGATVERFASLINKATDGDPDTNVEFNDVPVLRTMIGQKPSWYDRAAFYTRLNHVEEVVSRAREYRSNRDREGLREYREDQADVLELRRVAKVARKEIREIRHRRAAMTLAYEQGRIDAARRDAIRTRLHDREERLFSRFNQIYLREVQNPRRPER